MNILSILPGHNYALVESRTRGVFPMNGTKVKVTAKERVRKPGNTRVSARVHVEYTDRYGATKHKWVSAHKIFDFWEDYEAEVAAIKRKREAEAAERERAWAEQQRKALELREARARELREEADRKQAEDIALAQAFYNKTGIPVFELKFSQDNIILPRKAIEDWLNG